MTTAVSTPYYRTGGTLPFGHPSYVPRRADSELYEQLQEGHFCYVLTTRQMGKSSLSIRVGARLREAGVGVAVIDLGQIGKENATADQWYNDMLDQVGETLGLDDQLATYRRPNSESPLRRWMKAIRDVVMKSCPGRVVIFIDEIDAVRSLPFSTDEFFAGIREFYNRRAREPEFDRLTFCLLGVATPSDLIRNPLTTPFNIGRRIELDDFSRDEATPLAGGLRRDEATARRLMARVVYWSGGHPYLTQRLCEALAQQPKVQGRAGVDRLCKNLFLTAGARERDLNLLFVRSRILSAGNELANTLNLYAKVRRGQAVRDDEPNPLISTLRLSGIVKGRDGLLRVRNRIYQRAFDDRWVRTNMPVAEKERQRAAFRRGLLRGVVLARFTYGLLARIVL